MRLLRSPRRRTWRTPPARRGGSLLYTLAEILQKYRLGVRALLFDAEGHVLRVDEGGIFEVDPDVLREALLEEEPHRVLPVPVPDNALLVGASSVLFGVEGGKRTLLFQSGRTLQKVEAFLPASILLFAVKPSRKGPVQAYVSVSPKPLEALRQLGERVYDEPVYRAPLPNILSEEGLVCWGQNSIRDFHTVVDAFFKTPFSLEGGRFPFSRKRGSDFFGIWQEAKSAGAYPDDDLIQIGPVREWVAACLRRQ